MDGGGTTKMGWLKKQGGKVKSWKRRWFVLEEDRMTYYKDKEGTKEGTPLGFVPLGRCRLREPAQAGKHGGKAKAGAVYFELFNPEAALVQRHRSYLLQAESREELVSWEAALREKGVLREGDEEESAETELPRKTGWLNKQGGRWKNWRRRWFVLLGTDLYYYQSEKAADPVGLVPLGRDSVRVVADDASDSILCSKKFCFLITDALGFNKTHNVYYLQASSSDERDEWLEALKAAQEDGKRNTNDPVLRFSPFTGDITVEGSNANFEDGYEQDNALPIAAPPVVATLTNYLLAFDHPGEMLFMDHLISQEFRLRKDAIVATLDEQIGDGFNVNEFTPPEAGQLLLTYLDNLSLSVLPGDALYDAILQHSGSYDVGEGEQRGYEQAMCAVLKALPRTNLAVLTTIICFVGRLCTHERTALRAEDFMYIFGSRLVSFSTVLRAFVKEHERAIEGCLSYMLTHHEMLLFHAS